MRSRFLSLLLALFLALGPGCAAAPAPPPESLPPGPEEGPFRDWSGENPPARVRLGEEFLGWTLTRVAEVPGDPVTGWPGERRAVFEGKVWVRGLLIRDDGRGWYRQTVRFCPAEGQPLPRWDGFEAGEDISLLPEAVIPEEAGEQGYYSVRELRPMEYFREAEETLGLSEENRFLECRLLLTRWEAGQTQEPGRFSGVAFAAEVEPLRQEKDSGFFATGDKDHPAFLLEGEAIQGWTLEELDLSMPGGGRALFRGESTLWGRVYLEQEEGRKTTASLSLGYKADKPLPEWYDCPLAGLTLLPEGDLPEDTEAYNQMMEDFFQTAEQRPDRKYEYILTVSRYEMRKRQDDWKASEGTIYLSRAKVADYGVFTDRSESIEPREVRLGEQFLGWTLTDVTGSWPLLQWQGEPYAGNQAVFEGENTLRGWLEYVEGGYKNLPCLAFYPEDPSQLPMWLGGDGLLLFTYPDKSAREEWGREGNWVSPCMFQQGDKYRCRLTITRIECLRFGTNPSHNDIYFSKLEPLD